MKRSDLCFTEKEPCDNNESKGTEEIAPDGDVILVVGPTQRRLRVYSLILKNASKVFAAMFQGSFAEGESLRRSLGGDVPCEILLPEDDPDGMCLLCRVVHGRTEKEGTFKLRPRQILQVAIAADKYDCVAPLVFAVECWIKAADVDELKASPSKLWDMTAAAYWFNHEGAFTELSLALMLGYRGSFLTFTDGSDAYGLALQLSGECFMPPKSPC
jgi:hypothetical protein